MSKLKVIISKLSKLPDQIFHLLFYCPRGKHTRSKRHAHKVDDQWVSRCQNCGTPMVRLAKHRWAPQK